MRMRIEYQQLPPSVKKAVSAIIYHRRQVAHNATKFAGASLAIPLVFVMMSQLSTDPKPVLETKIRTLKKIAAATEVMIGGLAIFALRGHRQEYRKEYLQLLQSLQRINQRGRMSELFHAPNANYLCVNADGSISTRERMPAQLFKLPIGRRVVVNPMMSRSKINTWKQRLPTARQRKKSARHF